MTIIAYVLPKIETFTADDRRELVEGVVYLAGGVEPLANELGVTADEVRAWEAQGWVPPADAIRIEAAFSIRQELVAYPGEVEAQTVKGAE